MYRKDKDIIILGIESSCDDTSAAIIHNGKILSNCTANQKIHQEYGGVVPEWASRAHQKNIVPVVDRALKKANVKKKELSGIAFTEGPGLLGSLLVGASFAKSTALALDIPLIGVHHMKAHIMAHFIDAPVPPFPFLCLTVSGGHTQIVQVEENLNFNILGQTIDDAAGEAFDKIAKIMGFPYPGGPEIDRLAQSGNPDAFHFVEPSMEKFNFSFSGLKTNFLYFLQKETKKNADFIENNQADLCASIQRSIINVLMNKLTKAADKEKIKHIALAGGVAANSALRTRLQNEAEQRDWTVFIPQFQYCTDNAAMIAMLGYLQFKQGQFSSLKTTPQARMEM